jgi:hypothetical protein
LARCGKRDEISSPDSPCFENGNADAINLPSLAFINCNDRPSVRKLSGIGWPLNFVSVGLGSKVSNWLGPPAAKIKIIRWARAGKWVLLGARVCGPVRSDAETSRARSEPKTDAPTPNADRLRNSRRSETAVKRWQ